MTALASCAIARRMRRAAQLAQPRLGAGLTGFEAMNAFSLSLVAKHMPQLRHPLPAAPWTVLLELSDNESEAHARELLRRPARPGAGTRHDRRRRLAESVGAVAHDVAPARIDPAGASRGRAEHQARHRAAGVAHSGVLRGDRRGAGSSACRACGWSTSATSATATCTTTCRRRRAPMRRRSCASHETRGQRLVYAAVAAHGGSISAEHGIGLLKREELVQFKAPTALALMRAVKRALDPQG